MGLFSQRRGLKPIKEVVQIESMDADLRNGLWDALTVHYWPGGRQEAYRLPDDPSLYELCRRVWHLYFKVPVDTIPRMWSDTHRIIRNHFFDCTWYEVYDFAEFVANNPFRPYSAINASFMDFCNDVLEREMSGYRFVGGRITAITSEEEITEVEGAQQTTGALAPVSRHMQRALELMADRQGPDYRNSIKEAVSAVEAMCNLVAQRSGATLTQALRELDRNSTVVMHPALRGAFERLYGYTSDAEGIRHALLEEPNLSFEDAKFMLVSCSAFVNYLKAKSAKAGIDF